MYARVQGFLSGEGEAERGTGEAVWMVAGLRLGTALLAELRVKFRLYGPS